MRVLVSLALLLFLVFVADVAAQTLSAGSGTVAVGEKVEIPLVLDLAPNGLSGYGIRVSLEKGAVAEITDFSIDPAFMAVTDPGVDIAPDRKSALLGGLDLLDNIRAGARNVTLGRVAFKGLASGESEIVVEIMEIQDNEGRSFQPQTVSGTLRVTGGPPTQDTTPPQFSEEQPQQGFTVVGERQPVISVKISDEESGIEPATIEITITSGMTVRSFTLASSGAGWDGIKFSLDLRGAGMTLAAGVVDLEVVARDRAGNEGRFSWSFIVAAAPGAPAITLNEPAPGATLGTPDVEFSFTISDDKDERLGFELLIDGAVRVSGVAQSGRLHAERVVGLTDGRHNWQVRASDSDGNTAASERREFTIRTGAALTVEQAVAQHSGDPRIIEDADILWAIELWVKDAIVPGTDNLKIDDATMLRLIDLWIRGATVPASMAVAAPASKAEAKSKGFFDWLFGLFSQKAKEVKAVTNAKHEASLLRVMPGESFTVTVTLEAAVKAKGLLLAESLPEGWRIKPLDNGGAFFKASDSKWLWLAPAGTVTLSYEVTVPADAAAGVYEIAGSYKMVSPEGEGKPRPLKIEVEGTPVALKVQEIKFTGSRFVVEGFGIAGIEVKTYNLAGSLVFSGSTNRTALTLATDMPLANGVYLYVVTVKGINGQQLTRVQKLVLLR